MHTNLSDLNAPAENSHIGAMAGLTLLSSMARGNIDDITEALIGTRDYHLRCALYFVLKGERLPESVRDLMDAEVTVELARVKDQYRAACLHALNLVQHQESRQQHTADQRRFDQAAAKFRSMNAPAPEGTVDELAKRHGVSKSRVRLLKRENRLHELTGAASQ